MRRIEYLAPSSVDEAVRVLARRGAQARMLAGGTDLIVQVRENLRECDVFVDGKRIPELTQIGIDSAGGLTIGAAVACYRIYGDDRVTSRLAALVDATRIIGGIGIQGRASVGGNLCNSGPAGDSIPALIVHRAVCTIAGVHGKRSLPVEDFCTGPGRNALSADELLVSLQFPAPSIGAGAAYLRFIPREEMDIAVVGAAALVRLEEGTIRDARVAIGAVAATPLLVERAGLALIGHAPGEAIFEYAAEIAQAASNPITDMRGTAEHRRKLVGVLVRRALATATTRAALSLR